MNRQGCLLGAAALLLAAICFFGILTIDAIDRLNASIRDLSAKVEAANRAAPVPAAVQAAAETVTPAGEVANRGYFDPAAEPGGRLVSAVQADPQNLNYLINNDAAAAEFHGLVNSSLAAPDLAEPDVWRPLMAESWTISDDHLTYRIRLRRGILWQDFTDPVTGRRWENREVTARDFKFFIDVVRDPQVNCEPLRVYYQDLEGIEVVNDYEFIVRWKHAFYGSLHCTLGMSPLARHLYDDYPEPFDGARFNDDNARNRMIVGCGPYRFDRWEKDVRIVFVRNEQYFGKKLGIAPPLKYRVYEMIKLPNTRFQALLAGRLDLLGLTPEQWERRTDVPAFADGTLRKFQYPSHVYNYIGYNQKLPLFQDRRVRRALTMLVDREKILRDVYCGLGLVAVGPFFPGSPYADPAIRPWPYDVEAAKSLLAEAGWRDTDGDGVLDRNGERFSFTIMQVASNPLQQRMLPMIKESMALAGVEMKIQPLEWSVCLQRLQDRTFEACTLGWTLPSDPDPYQVWHSSMADIPGSSNHIAYRNPELDRLIEELRATFDRDRRIELCHKIGAILHEDQPYTFLFVPMALTALSGRYRNVRLFPDSGLAAELFWVPAAEQRPVPGL